MLWTYVKGSFVVRFTMKKIIRLILGVWMMSTTASFAQKGVFFSEYAEGTSSNKYLEVYNGSGVDINLKQYAIRTASNGGGWQNNLVLFKGQDSILKAGAVYVIGNSQANQTIKDSSDETNAVTFFNGNDARALVYLNGTDTLILDQVCDPNSSAYDDVAGISEGFRNDGAWIRKSHIEEGNYGNWNASRGSDSVSSEWLFTPGPTATFTPATLKLHEQKPVRHLQAGDLAIIAYRTGANTIDDEFAMVSFVDIKEGTQLNITDMKYTENGISQCEGGLVWTAPAGIKAGDVIVVGNDNTVVDKGTISGKSFGLGKSGDQIIIYEGPFFNPNFVTALSSNAWSSSGVTSCKGGASLLPKGLTNGTNAISHEATNGNVSGVTINAYYSGSQLGTTAEVKSRVFDYANWNGAGDKVDQIWPKWSFFKEVSAPSFRLLSPANGADVTVEENDTTSVVISWEAEENAVAYTWKIVAASGDFSNPALIIPSDNSGTDTTLSLSSGAIDAALAGLAIPVGVKVDLKWTVTAYFITGDSLNADTFHTIAITRKDNTPVTYNFKAGDMAVVAYRMNASTPDEFALLTFVDIPAGAQLNFSDDKVASGVQCDGGDLVWTAPAGGIKAGTVIAVLNDNPAVSLGTLTGGSFGLSSGGDQIMIFEGTPDKAQHITALSSNAWSADPVTCTSKSTSELPSNLTNGTNAISHEMTTGNDAGNTANAYYTGTMEGTFDEIKKLVSDYKNWNGAAAGTEAQQWPDWNFTGKAASTTALSAFQFRVFPNPSNGLIHFNKAIQAQVYNVSGVLVEASNAKVDRLDLRHLNAGIYFIKNEYGATQKISIQ